MSLNMQRFETQLDRTNFQPLNGKADPYDLVASVHGNVGDAHEMMVQAGVLGWQHETVPLYGMDKAGNFYEAPTSTRAIVVPQFPGGPAYFGHGAEGFKFIRPEAVVPLIDAVVAHGNRLTGISPGPVTRFFFDSKLIDITPYSQQARDSVGELIQIRWQLDLGNTGKNSLKFGQNGMRLWCANGCTTAETMGSVSISHDNLASAKIAAVVNRILERGDLGLEKWIADARQTITKRMSLDQAMMLWAELFKWSDEKEDRALTIQENQQATLTQLWRSPTQQVTFPDTAWAFFGATTEYLDHEATVKFAGSSREEALARRVVEGNTAVATVKNRAWEMALAI